MVKKFIDRLTGGGRPDPERRREDDSGFFSTLFLDRTDDSQAFVSWPTRAEQVAAQPYERARGLQRFIALWNASRHAVNLDAEELDQLADYLEFAQVDAGREVIVQDEQGDYLLIVLEGQLAVDRVQPWGARARLAEARPGDMLGEMSLLDAGARFSACVTLTPCVLAVLDARRLDQMIRLEPRLALALLASLSRRLSLRLRQVSARLGALLSRD